MSTGPNFDLSEQGAHGINRKWWQNMLDQLNPVSKNKEFLEILRREYTLFLDTNRR